MEVMMAGRIHPQRCSCSVKTPDETLTILELSHPSCCFALSLDLSPPPPARCFVGALLRLLTARGGLEYAPG